MFPKKCRKVRKLCFSRGLSMLPEKQQSLLKIIQSTSNLCANNQYQIQRNLQNSQILNFWIFEAR